MNYQKIYDDLIYRAKTREELSGYVEKHHIIPRCLGGTDSKDNLVRLTYREHFVCHKLLCKIYPGNIKLMYAMSFMIYSSSKNPRIVSSKDFSYVKSLIAPHMGSWNVGRTPWNKGLRGEEFKLKNPNNKTPSMLGYKWINNGVEQTKLAPTKQLPENWYYGRLDNRGDNNGMRKKCHLK